MLGSRLLPFQNKLWNNRGKEMNPGAGVVPPTFVWGSVAITSFCAHLLDLPRGVTGNGVAGEQHIGEPCGGGSTAGGAQGKSLMS